MGDVEESRVRGKGRDRSGLDHRDVGHIDIFGYNKGRRAHDGGCELAIGAGRHLYRSSLLGRISHLFHQGDGEGAGGNNVGDARAGHQAGEPAAHNGSLGRPSLEPPQKTQGQIDEIPARPCLVQHGTKENEQEDNGGRNIQGDAVDAFGGHGHLAYESIQRHTLEGDEIGHMGPQKGVSDKASGNGGKRRADYATRGLQEQDCQGYSNNNITGVRITIALDDSTEVNHNIYG